MAILRFRHKGLERFFTTGTTAKIQAQHAERLRLILARLNVATEPRDMDLPGLRGCEEIPRAPWRRASAMRGFAHGRDPVSDP
jgi:plasmid maintenance system killer protein